MTTLGCLFALNLSEVSQYVCVKFNSLKTEYLWTLDGALALLGPGFHSYLHCLDLILP